MANRVDLRGIRLVSWDVDGTLFSYFRLTAGLLRWRRFNLKELREAWDFHRLVEKQRRSEDARVVAAEMERYREPQCREREALQAVLARTPPRTRAVELIRRFASAGIPQVALSDFECAYKLDALGLKAYFEKAYSCEQLGFWKPSPVPLSKVQSDFGCDARQHLHIGDRMDTDGEACVRNGCRFLLIDSRPKLWRAFNIVCSL